MCAHTPAYVIHRHQRRADEWAVYSSLFVLSGKNDVDDDADDADDAMNDESTRADTFHAIYALNTMN